MEGRLVEVGVFLLEVFAEKSAVEVVLDLARGPELALAVACAVVKGLLGAEVKNVERDEPADAVVVERVTDEEARP